MFVVFDRWVSLGLKQKMSEREMVDIGTICVNTDYLIASESIGTFRIKNYETNGKEYVRAEFCRLCIEDHHGSRFSYFVKGTQEDIIRKLKGTDHKGGTENG